MTWEDPAKLIPSCYCGCPGCDPQPQAAQNVFHCGYGPDGCHLHRPVPDSVRELPDY